MVNNDYAAKNEGEKMAVTANKYGGTAVRTPKPRNDNTLVSCKQSVD